MKASPGSICRWRDARDQHGEAGLNAKRHPGGKPRLTEAQRARLLTLLSQGACAHGFHNELWTLRRVAAIVQRHFGISYCPSSLFPGEMAGVGMFSALHEYAGLANYYWRTRAYQR